jgi:SAM-dependent methyltransferase
MNPEGVRYFACPACSGDLVLSSQQSTTIVTGELKCSSCARVYPVRGGIPRFVEEEQYTDTFGRQWNRWDRTQHDSINGTSIYRDRMLRYTGWTPESMKGKVVIDAGCGAGAYVDVAERHATAVLGFDLSSAIEAAYRLHGKRPNVHLAQADIFRPPFKPGIADRLYCFGVVQHTPDPERAFRSLIPLVRPGGEMAVWVYRRWAVPQPSYWMRRLTRGMPEPKATRFIEWYVPKALKVSEALGTIPRVGKTLRRLVPVADYRDRLPLTPEQHREWALMDTHDMLITRHTHPQRWTDLQRWMKDLEGVHRPSDRDMAAVGRVPASVASNRSSA